MSFGSPLSKGLTVVGHKIIVPIHAYVERQAGIGISRKVYIFRTNKGEGYGTIRLLAVSTTLIIRISFVSEVIALLSRVLHEVLLKARNYIAEEVQGHLVTAQNSIVEAEEISYCACLFFFYSMTNNCLLKNKSKII